MRSDLHVSERVFRPAVDALNFLHGVAEGLVRVLFCELRTALLHVVLVAVVTDLQFKLLSPPINIIYDVSAAVLAFKCRTLINGYLVGACVTVAVVGRRRGVMVVCSFRVRDSEITVICFAFHLYNITLN